MTAGLDILNIVLMIVVAILVFGVVIFIHELGHFIAAKRGGIKVNEFALGMGPTLFKFTKGETKYALRLFPIGGFVSMEGEDEESDDSRGFQKASIPRRLIVTVAGAVMNLILGFLVLVVLVAFSRSDLVGTRTIHSVKEGSPPALSGLQAGDTILKVNGRSIFVFNDVDYELQRTADGVMDLLVERDGQKIELPGVVFTVDEVVDEQTGESYQTIAQDFAILGVPKTFGSVISGAFQYTLFYGRIIYLSLFDLVTGNVPINQLSGPVGIVSEIGKAVSVGWDQVLNLLALITINLGIVNMLPLPALDGGRAVLLVIEAIRRKPIPQKFEIAINMAGFALLILLMIFVSFSDIQKLFFS